MKRLYIVGIILVVVTLAFTFTMTNIIVKDVNKQIIIKGWTNAKT